MPQPIIALTRTLPPAAERDFLPGWVVERLDVRGPLDVATARRALAAADVVVCTVTDRFGAEAFSPAPRARLLASYGVGVDHVDLRAAATAGVTVTNTPDVLTESTAELAMTLMLMAARRTGEGERLVRAGAWSGWAPDQLLGRELGGRTIGIVGMGRIGRAMARRAALGCGMRVAYWSRSAADLTGERFEATRHARLEDLLGSVDVVSLHVPGGDNTRHLIDGRALGRMRPDAILVNTARGAVVDEAALADALASGAIASAGLDVYEDEPMVHARLLGLDNVVLLPHLGSATVEARAAMGARVAANIRAVLSGEVPPDVVTA